MDCVADDEAFDSIWKRVDVGNGLLPYDLEVPEIFKPIGDNFLDDCSSVSSASTSSVNVQKTLGVLQEVEEERHSQNNPTSTAIDNSNTKASNNEAPSKASDLLDPAYAVAGNLQPVGDMCDVSDVLNKLVEDLMENKRDATTTERKLILNELYDAYHGSKEEQTTKYWRQFRITQEAFLLFVYGEHTEGSPSFHTKQEEELRKRFLHYSLTNSACTFRACNLDKAFNDALNRLDTVLLEARTDKKQKRSTRETLTYFVYMKDADKLLHNMICKRHQHIELARIHVLVNNSKSKLNSLLVLVFLIMVFHPKFVVDDETKNLRRQVLEKAKEKEASGKKMFSFILKYTGCGSKSLIKWERLRKFVSNYTAGEVVKSRSTYPTVGYLDAKKFQQETTVGLFVLKGVNFINKELKKRVKREHCGIKRTRSGSRKKQIIPDLEDADDASVVASSDINNNLAELQNYTNKHVDWIRTIYTNLTDDQFMSAEQAKKCLLHIIQTMPEEGDRLTAEESASIYLNME